DTRGLRIGEHHPRHGFMMGLAGFAKNVGRDNTALIFSDMGQQPDAVDVADRPQALAGTQMRIDRNAIAFGFDADGFQANSLDPRTPAGPNQQPVAAQRAAIVEFEKISLAVAARRGRVYAEREFDAVAAQDF